jgi:hypothetical protein
MLNKVRQRVLHCVYQRCQVHFLMTTASAFQGQDFCSRRMQMYGFMEVEGICVFPGHFAAYSGIALPTFRENLSVLQE